MQIFTLSASIMYVAEFNLNFIKLKFRSFNLNESYYRVTLLKVEKNIRVENGKIWNDSDV